MKSGGTREALQIIFSDTSVAFLGGHHTVTRGGATELVHISFHKGLVHNSFRGPCAFFRLEGGGQHKAAQDKSNLQTLICFQT